MEPHLGMSHFTFWVVKVAQLRHLGARTLMRSKKAFNLYDNGLFLRRSTGLEFSAVQMPSFDFMDMSLSPWISLSIQLFLMERRCFMTHGFKNF